MVGIGSIVPGDVFVVVLALVVGVCVCFYQGVIFSFPGMGLTFLSDLSYVRVSERERERERKRTVKDR
jgi:hypothetical protein